MLGRSAESLIGKRLPEEFPESTGLPYYRQVMSERVPVRFESFASMAGVWVEVHAYPTLEGISMIVSDITERKTAELEVAESRRLDESLASIGTMVTTSLDSDEILHRLVTLSAEAMGAETAGLTLSSVRGWVVRSTVGMPAGPIRTVLNDPQLEAAFLSAEPNEPIVIDDVDQDPRVDPQFMKRLGVKSLLLVPLVAKGNVIGALVFRHRTKPTPFTEAQVDFATNLSILASLALENARVFERERKIADTLQQSLLSKPASAPGIESAMIYRPASDSANVGGDFYDVFLLDDGRLCFTVGDVSGKGLTAARLTSVLHDGIRAYAYEDPDPSAVMGRVNRLVHRMSGAEQFATAVYGVLDIDTGHMEYCLAAHPPPVMVGPDGAALVDGAHSPIIGGFPEIAYRTHTSTLGDGEMLVLYTDGLTEARCGHEMFGEERLVRELTRLRHASTARMPTRVLSTALRFTGGALHDDLVILCLKRTGRQAAEDGRRRG